MQKKWERREKKLEKRKTGMRVTGRSVFTLQGILKRKADLAARTTKPKIKPKTAKRKTAKSRTRKKRA
jgi:hypothetical protein